IPTSRWDVTTRLGLPGCPGAPLVPGADSPSSTLPTVMDDTARVLVIQGTPPASCACQYTLRRLEGRHLVCGRYRQTKDRVFAAMVGGEESAPLPVHSQRVVTWGIVLLASFRFPLRVCGG